MENRTQKILVNARWMLAVLFLTGQSVFAQIPQNIKVEGEVDDGWSLVFYLLALVIIILGIFLVGKYFKRRK
jgi:uncharacterized membrane protein YhdT